MLHAPRDAHDGDAEQQAEYAVDNGNLPPAEQDPEQVHHRGEATGLARPEDHRMAERPESKRPQLEELQPERNPDDGHAHHQAHDEIQDRNDEAAEEQPEDIAEKSHNCVKFILQRYAN